MIDLGLRIRKERQSKGWSLKKLSGLIGVSIMTLQRIETGKVSPSVDLLVELSYQLGLPVTEFVSDKERTLVHLTSKDLPLEKKDGYTRKPIFPDGLVQEGFLVSISEMEKDGIIDWPARSRFEGAHVLDGTGEIEFDDRKVRLQKGESIFYDARFRQRIKTNTGFKVVSVNKD